MHFQINTNGMQIVHAGERGQDPPQSINQRAVRDCPWCAETIKAAAIVCRFCGREVEALPAAGSATASRTGLGALRAVLGSG